MIQFLMISSSMLFENFMFFLFFGKTFKKILIFLITVRDPVIRERIRFGEGDHNSMFTRRNFFGDWIFIIVSIIITNYKTRKKHSGVDADNVHFEGCCISIFLGQLPQKGLQISHSELSVLQNVAYGEKQCDNVC